LAAIGLGIAILAFTIVGLLMAGFVLFLSWAVRPLTRRPSAESTYECGFPAQGDRRAIGFGYFTYAAVFLLFDLAVLYLYLYASAQGIWNQTIWWFLGGLTTLLVAIVAAAKGVMARAA
jgi:NADH:ubiquinone oxidoreductase subunit 3 (subunit A)